MCWIAQLTRNQLYLFWGLHFPLFDWTDPPQHPPQHPPTSGLAKRALHGVRMSANIASLGKISSSLIAGNDVKTGRRVAHAMPLPTLYPTLSPPMTRSCAPCGSAPLSHSRIPRKLTTMPMRPLQSLQVLPLWHPPLWHPRPVLPLWHPRPALPLPHQPMDGTALN